MGSEGGKFFNINDEDNEEENNISYTTKDIIDDSDDETYEDESYDDYSNEKKFHLNKKFLLIILLVIVIIVVVVIISISSRSGGTEDGSILNQGDRLIIKNSLTDATIIVTDVERNFKVVDNSVITLSEDTSYADFTRLYLDVRNNKKNSFNFLLYVDVDLLNSKKEKIADCDDGTNLFDYEIEEPIGEVEKESSKDGYMYCKTDSSKGKMLRVKALSKIDKKEARKGNIKELDSDTYYIRLN